MTVEDKETVTNVVDLEMSGLLKRVHSSSLRDDLIKYLQKHVIYSGGCYVRNYSDLFG